MSPPPTTSAGSRSSVNLGSTLRSVLVTPGDGFRAALDGAERKSRRREPCPEGRSPYVLGALGGMALMMLWLKLGGLIGGREAVPGSFGWGEIFLALVAGAAGALAAQILFGLLGPLGIGGLGGGVTGRDLRLVWGAAAFPQVFVVLFVLPLDLVIVGPQIFSTSRLEDSLSTVWAALSIALCSACAVWSLTLFARGVQVAGGTSLPRAALGVLVALACLVLVVVAGSLSLQGVWG